MLQLTNEGRLLVYPFSRELLGMVWSTPEELQRMGCTLENVVVTEQFTFCSQMADLPAEMVCQLFVSLECNGGGVNLDVDRLRQWREHLRRPIGGLVTKVSCARCPAKNEVRLMDVMYLTNIASGLTCPQLGKDCTPAEASSSSSSAPMSSPMPASVPTQVGMQAGTLGAGPVAGITLAPQNTTPTTGVGLPSTQQAVASQNSVPQLWNISSPGDASGAPTPTVWRHTEQMAGVWGQAGGASRPTSATGMVFGAPPPTMNTGFLSIQSGQMPALPQLGQVGGTPGNQGTPVLLIPTAQGYVPIPQPTAAATFAAPSGQGVPLPYGTGFPQWPSPGTGTNGATPVFLNPQQAGSTYTFTYPAQGGSGPGTQPSLGSVPMSQSSAEQTPSFSSVPPQSRIPPPPAGPPPEGASGNAQTGATPEQGRRPPPPGAGTSSHASNPTAATTHVAGSLQDEVVEVNELFHSETAVPPAQDPNAESSTIRHPTANVRGRILKYFKASPPTVEERLMLQRLIEEGKYAKYLENLSKKMQDRTVEVFTGKGDASDYADWEASLLKYFHGNKVYNSALRAAMAVSTFGKKANAWWIAHTNLRPRLTLSWPQMRELIRTEMIPDAPLGGVNEGWLDLRYTGEPETYFEKVERLATITGAPPEEYQIMGAKPFGRVLVERIRSTLAERGRTSLPPPEWEKIVRAHIYQVETAPGFQHWPQETLEPVFKANKSLKQATVRECQETRTWEEMSKREGEPIRHTCCHAHAEIREDDPEVTSDVPPGMDEEAWDSKVVVLRATLAVPPPKPAAGKIGKGNRPCFVCGEADHSWIRCKHRKKGKCGVCGSRDHYTRFCLQRYRPDPKLFDRYLPGKGTASTSADSAKGAAATTAKEDGEVEDTTPLKAGGVVCADHLPEMPTDWALLRQACIPDECDLALPGWLRKRMKDVQPRERVGKAVVPLEDPMKVGQLFYPATMDGKAARMLYDPGASHCFLDWQWAQDNGIRVRTCSSASLNMFQGTALGAIQWTYISNDFGIGDSSYAWKFLVIKPAPADIVMGLNFLLHHRPVLDFASLYLYPTAPRTREKKAQALCKLEDTAEAEEQDLVTVCDTSKASFLQGLNVFKLGDYSPYWESERIQLYSTVGRGRRHDWNHMGSGGETSALSNG